jgi:hypothetical protein
MVNNTLNKALNFFLPTYFLVGLEGISSKIQPYSKNEMDSLYLEFSFTSIAINMIKFLLDP